MIKYTIEYMKQYFKDNDCELLENEYINTHTKMQYKCNNNHINNKTFTTFRQGSKCNICFKFINGKFNIKSVTKYFKDINYELLEEKYINTRTYMNYKCNNNHISFITLSSLKLGQRCKLCPQIIKEKNFNITKVRQYFKDNNYELLENVYIDNKTKMKYKCDNDHVNYTTFANFKIGSRCSDCYGNKKYTIKEAKQYFKDNDYELLEDKYINGLTKMKYKCNNKHINYISFSHFKNGTRCSNCNKDSLRFTFEYVNQCFLDRGCKLLETKYINANTKLKYICSCGNYHSMIFNGFKNGNDCKECGYDKTQKKSKSYKDYILPSNKIVAIQGYENIALDELFLNNKYKEEDIITNRRDMPIIKYYLNGTMHQYFPDIMIISENKIIEVKSNYTYKLHLIKNIMKALATRNDGFSFEFWIYDHNKIKLVL